MRDDAVYNALLKIVQTAIDNEILLKVLRSQGWYCFESTDRSFGSKKEIEEWLDSNTKGEYIYSRDNPDIICFQNSVDATLFKLRWL